MAWILRRVPAGVLTRWQYSHASTACRDFVTRSSSRSMIIVGCRFWTGLIASRSEARVPKRGFVRGVPGKGLIFHRFSRPREYLEDVVP